MWSGATRQAEVADGNSFETRRLELRYRLWFRLIDLAGRISDRAIPAATAVLIVYFGFFRTAHELAAKTTLANLGIKLLADVKPDEIVAYAAAIVGWLLG